MAAPQARAHQGDVQAPAPSAGPAYCTPAQLVRHCLCCCKAFIKPYMSDLKTLNEKMTRLLCLHSAPSRIVKLDSRQGSKQRGIVRTGGMHGPFRGCVS